MDETTPDTPSLDTASGPAYRYGAALARSIEPAWQRRWAEQGVYHAPNPVGDLAAADGELPADKLFVQDMFPYPSGAGLHVGHPLGYIATDVFARYHRMLGRNVLHTLGYDAFGLPAEQYAVQTGTHPRVTTEANIENMERQLGRLGLGHDKRRSVATTDLEFYRWTQWIFLKIFNSWYDETAENATGSRGRARPIEELREAYASGEVALPEEFAGRDFSELSRIEQERALDARRLVYQSDSEVNWCPGLGTVLANEEVTADGRSERGNFPVFRKKLTQWMMRITAYADRLVDDLEHLDWPDKVKTMQRNWIGRSHGAAVRFPVALGGVDEAIEVFTTRPDTLCGATYVALAPEHELVAELLRALPSDEWPAGTAERWTGGAATPGEAVAAYRAASAEKTDEERRETKEKTGVFTGAFARNPVTGEEVPIFVADYVLTGYGTGAVMAVPAHDERDYAFAAALDLPVRGVVTPTAGEQPDLSEAAFTDHGFAINSSPAASEGLALDGLPTAEAKETIIAWLEHQGLGHGTINYKLRDWLFARQRYWGEPFPVVYDEDGVAHGLPESMLPVELPEVEDYTPVSFDPDDESSVPSPPLAKATDWVTVELDLGDGLKTYTRDTNVMPQWAGSSWYQLRYIDPTNSEAPCDPANEQYWVGPRPEEHGAGDLGGVDLYVGGVEHAVLHLLYSRFWHKVLFDLGVLSSVEPYRTLFNQGYIQAHAFTDARGSYVPAAEVEEIDGKWLWTPTPESARPLGATPAVPQEVSREYGKMGKSLKNAVSPDEICDDFGADTLRVYEMSMGPLDQSRPWATKDVVGAHRFLQRVWRLVVDETTGELLVTDGTVDEDAARALHRTIDGVRGDYANLRVNTAVAKLIEYTNYLTKHFAAAGIPAAPRAAVEPLVLMIAPVAPHLADELWQRLGHDESLVHAPFPEADESLLVDDTVEYPVQINGKVRARITVAAAASREEVEVAAITDERIQELTAGKSVVKVIVVPGKMVNLVLR